MKNAGAFDTRVHQILRRASLIDGHNDFPWALRKLGLNGGDSLALAPNTSRLKPPLVTDLARLKAGGVGAQFWAVYVPPTNPSSRAVVMLFEQIDLVHRLIARYPKTLELAVSADDILRSHRRGKIASLIGLEGGHAIDNSLGVLRAAFALGARYMTLTHVKNNDWADASTDAPRHHGLARFGREVVREMNRLGMMVDLSHVSDETALDVFKISKAPVIFSHSCARALCRHRRNVPDSLLQRVKRDGGIVMATFVPEYLTEPERLDEEAAVRERARLVERHGGNEAAIVRSFKEWRKVHPAPQRAELSDVADHIDHIREIAGIDFVGIGSDFDGFRTPPPVGLENVARYPVLLAELFRRGYSAQDVRKVAGLNLLRVFREVGDAAER